MTLIEILTAISLFCPHVKTSMYESYPAPVKVEEACRDKAWKCIDKERENAQKCGDGFFHKDNKDRFISYCQEHGLERCFR